MQTREDRSRSCCLSFNLICSERVYKKYEQCCSKVCTALPHCLSWLPPSLPASSPCSPLPPPLSLAPPLSISLSPPTRDEVNRHVVVTALPERREGEGASSAGVHWAFTLLAGLLSVKQATTHVCISAPCQSSNPPATRQLSRSYPPAPNSFFPNRV